MFWNIAAEIGNEVVLGSDAHKPWTVTDPESEEKVRTMAKGLGLKLLDTVPLRKI